MPFRRSAASVLPSDSTSQAKRSGLSLVRGHHYEQQVERYLRRRGWRIAARNWRGAHSELDIVASRWRTTHRRSPSPAARPSPPSTAKNSAFSAAAFKPSSTNMASTNTAFVSISSVLMAMIPGIGNGISGEGETNICA